MGLNNTLLDVITGQSLSEGIIAPRGSRGAVGRRGLGEGGVYDGGGGGVHDGGRGTRGASADAAVGTTAHCHPLLVETLLSGQVLAVCV